jgi:hypothetical protein
MMRVTRLAVVWMAMLIGGATAVQAQTPPGPDSRFYAEFTAAATLGHKSDSSFGGEFDMRLNQFNVSQLNQLEVFFEAGHMGNVATSDLDRRAEKIANFIGGTSGAVQKATFFDIGVKYRGPVFATRWYPYIGFGLGRAKIKTIANFVVNGTDVTSQLPTFDPPVELGNDLTDSLSKGLLVVPIGVQATFAKRYVVDGSYRYGRILASSAIDGDVGISTQRLQIGVGIRF